MAMIVDFETIRRVKEGDDHCKDFAGDIWFFYTIDFIHKGRKFAVPFAARNDEEAYEIFDTIKSEGSVGSRVLNTLES